MGYPQDYSVGSTDLTLICDDFDEIEVYTKVGILCVIPKEERNDFLADIRAVIEKYAI